MTSNIKSRICKIGFVGLILISVVFAFVLFIKDNNKRAVSISSNYVKDAAVQSAQRIDDVLTSAQAGINTIASLYSETMETPEVNISDIKSLASEYHFDYIEFTDRNGIDINAEGQIADVSDRNYFFEGMQGKSGMDVIFDSRITNETLVIFYTPLYFDGEIIGVLTGSYRESQMQEILLSTFFGESARTFLCLKDGSVIASCNWDVTPPNIFDNEQFTSSNIGEDTEEQLKHAFTTGESFGFQYQGTNGIGNAYVLELETSGWILFQTFPSKVTNNMVQNANRAGTILLLELIIIFVICLVIVVIQNYIQKRKIMLESNEKSYVVDGITQLFGAFVLIDLEKATYRYLAGTGAKADEIPREGDYDSFLEYFISLVIEEDDKEHLSKCLAKGMLWKNLNEQTPFLRYEYRINRGSEKWDNLTLICLKRKDGHPVEVLFTYQDVTKVKRREQRSYEALKEAYHAAKSANQAKSDFLSNMSHDIRTPMNAIMGMTRIATMNLEDKERVEDCLNKIMVSSQHLLGLINEVLDMSKIESGKLSLSEEAFNLSEMVDRVLTMMLPQFKAKNQQFNVSVSNIIHEEVIGDSMRLQQVFVNILGNAMKFTPEGGRITLSMEEKQLDKNDRGCYEFVFEDTGIGMEEDFIDKLFEPFVRADNSCTEAMEGTGLGMPIVRNIVQMMNGDIKVWSKLGEGSRFTVTVYLNLNHTGQAAFKELSTLSVLVVDDDRFACESACAMLNEIGILSDWVMSGDEALDKLIQAERKGKAYSAVILDWKMPGKDGIETTREIRSKFGDEIPIIILSAFDYSDIEPEARQAGVDAFISKPLFRSRLIYVMKTLVAGEDKPNTELEDLRKRDYKGSRVLVVEDNALNMEIAVELLTEAGVAVETVYNGRQAVERMNETPENYYSLIFMDIQMPEMNGYEATEAIRASGREDLRSIPIVAMSANAFDDDVKHAMDAGMNGHVAKPVEIDKLVSALETWIKL